MSQTLFKLYQETPNFVTTGQKCGKLYMNITVRCIIAGDRKSPYKRTVRLKLYQAVKKTRNLGVRRVQPTRCDVSQFIYFCKMLYMFQTVFPSIIRSSKLHIQRQVFVGPILLPAVSLARLAVRSSIGPTNT